MAATPWWYSVIHEWRHRAFLETHHWPPAITLTLGTGAEASDRVSGVAMLPRTH